MDKEDEDNMMGEGSDSDNELETAVLEKMVEKLARIVKHVTHDNDLVVDDNVDSATASWLTQNYAGGQSKKRNAVVKGHLDDISEEDQALKLQASHKSVDPKVVNSWDFDVLQYDYDQLYEYNRYIFDVFNAFSEFNISPSTMDNLLKELSVRYIKENTYHNFHHACDVTHTTYRLIMVSRAFSMLIAAIGHDVGHPGVNNAFIVKTRHELAMIHNDKSPLENMHCSLLYELFRKPEMNVMASLDDAQWRESRKIILSLILGTDMAHHFDQISKTQLFLEVNGDDVKKFCHGQHESIECFGEEKNRVFIMELFLHCADISNPYKPFHICSAWADLVSQEFFSQGDKERAASLDVSPMMDRDSSNLFNMQMGFIEFVVSPL
ncbi:regA, partial [Symbiodinium microadriaticum]